MTSRALDFIVVGAGIAGISVAHELSKRGTVAVLEQESHAAYHSTGRSAAIFVESYGGPDLHALSRASRAFLESPDLAGSERSLLRNRGIVYAARVGEEHRLAYLDRYDPQKLLRLDLRDLGELVPVIDRDVVSAAVLEPSAADIDVHGLHQLYARDLAARGGRLYLEARVNDARRTNGVWRIDTETASFQAPILVNAAGPWAGALGALLGGRDWGLVPYRRSAALIDPPDSMPVDGWPMVVDAGESVYFKPDAGKLMISPADETPSIPCDAVAEDIDIAVAVHRFESLTTMDVRRVSHRWAGLRTLAPDRMPVIGFDPMLAGLFWLAGQGGVGVQTAPAAARIAAALITGESVPGDLTAHGVVPEVYSPRRFCGAPTDALSRARVTG